MSSPQRTWQALLLAGAGGLLLSAAFPPLGWWFLAPVAVAAITIACRVDRLRAAVAAGFVAGLGFFATTLSWVGVVGWDAWLILAAYCSIWLAAIGAGTWIVRALPWWPLAVASMWIVAEAGRARVPLGGFAWGRLGFSQADSPAAALASVGGVPLVGFAVAISGALLAAWLAARCSARSMWLPALAVAIMGSGLLLPLPVAGESVAGPPTTVAAVVQGSVPQAGLDAMSERQVVLTNHVLATIQLSQDVASGRVPAPQYVIWPENSTDVDPYTSEPVARAISQAADAIGVPILVGAVVQNPGSPTTLLNAGIVWNPRTGPSEVYAKRHLVPFGEFVPMRPLLTRLISRYERVPFDFVPGTHDGVLDLGPARIGDVICFEVADDAIVRDEVTSGSRVLTVQTNNATYAATSQPEQQLAISRLRAIEHGRSVLIAATSGLTAIIAPDATVLEMAVPNASQSLVRSVAMRDSLTLADRVGLLPELLAGFVTLVAVVAGIRRRSIGRADAPAPQRVHADG